VSREIRLYLDAMRGCARSEWQALLSVVDRDAETTLTIAPVRGTWAPRGVHAHLAAVEAGPFGPESWDAEKSPIGWLPAHDREHATAVRTLRAG